MSDEQPDAKVQPVILGIIFALILATLVFVLATGDYGESQPMEDFTVVQPVEIAEPVVVEVEPEPESVPAFVPEPVAPPPPPPPAVTEETADSFAREVIDSLNGGKALKQFVAGDYVVERSVAIVDALRRGEVPYKLLPVGKPASVFPTLEDGVRVTMNPTGFTRYDGFANWVNSLDVAAIMAVFNDYESLATTALSRMGVNDFDIRGAALAATTHILATPTLPENAELVRDEANWAYKDPELESLTPLQKQVLRMGPDNAELVQQKARELRGALLGDLP
jgi:hypothetical protein